MMPRFMITRDIGNVLLIMVVTAAGFAALTSSHVTIPESATAITNWFADPVEHVSVSSDESIDGKLGMSNTHPISSGISVTPHKTTGPSHGAVLAAEAVVTSCGLSFSVVPTVSMTAESGTITYQVNLKNNGQTSCQNVSYSTYYSEYETYVSATPKSSAGNYYWRVGTLAVDAQYTGIFVTSFAAGSNAQVKNEVCVTADNAEGDVCVETITSMNNNESTFPSAPGSASMPIQDSVPTAPQAAPVPVQNPVPEFSVPVGKEFGVWVWESPIQMTTAQASTILTEAKRNGMNAIYITIDDYLAVAVLPAGVEKNARIQQYHLALNRFITEANKLGIAVDVEGGWKDWGISKNRWKGYALIDFVKDYNQKYPLAKIRALQYDVEPYLLPSYEENKASTLTPFVAFIDESAKRMADVDAGFSIVIPHFYDATQKWTPQITYNGKKAHTYTHLLSVLKKKPGSTIIIMSYRNFFEGNDGVEQLSAPEIAEAATSGSGTKVIVAQETGNVDPNYVTFYGFSKSDYLDAVNAIYTGFSHQISFAGVATHYMDSFLQLQ
jgi:hypothetical protein